MARWPVQSSPPGEVSVPWWQSSGMTSRDRHGSTTGPRSRQELLDTLEVHPDKLAVAVHGTPRLNVSLVRACCRVCVTEGGSDGPRREAVGPEGSFQ